METGYLLDEVFGERLLISVNADKNELYSNIRAARAISMLIYIVSDIKILSTISAMNSEIEKE